MNKKRTTTGNPCFSHEEGRVALELPAVGCQRVGCGKHESGLFDAEKLVNRFRFSAELSACQCLDLDLPVRRWELTPRRNRWLFDAQGPRRFRLRTKVIEYVLCLHGPYHSCNYGSLGISSMRTAMVYF